MITLDSAQFISDLHISSSCPDIIRRFVGYMRGPALESEALFVLGDLFEYWPGDDLLDQDSNSGACARNILSEISDYTTQGRQVYLLHGNRDFLLGAHFCEASGSFLIEDGALISVSRISVEVLHGDLLCTDDFEYQHFRSVVRSENWRNEFLAKPLAERESLMGRMRSKSEHLKSKLRQSIMDVSEQTVAAEFTKSGADLMIHGHTHRPACHQYAAGIRWVLPAWDERGGYLTIDADGAKQGTLPTL